MEGLTLTRGRGFKLVREAIRPDGGWLNYSSGGLALA
jgi:hypothetical protein